MKQFLLKIFTPVVILLATSSLHAQVITTIAGTPDATGYSGDYGAATAALLFSPSDIVLDTAGNLYVADFINNVIRKIDTGGLITTVAGDGFGAGATMGSGGGYTGDGAQATAAELNGPFGLTLDASGNIIFADGYNHAVRKVNISTGIISTIAGHNAVGYTGDGAAATAATLDNPVDVAFDKHGNLYIADDHNNVIRKVDNAGIITTFAGNHTAGYMGDGSAATGAEISDPIGVAVDTAGNVYIADADNNVVRKVNADGIISTFAGNDTAGYTGDGGQATAAELRSPERITIDDTGNVYISDFINNVVRKVSPSGIISTFAGTGTGSGTMGMMGAFSGDGGPATAAELFDPQGVAIDHSGRVYICDRGNEIIRRVGPAVIVDTVNHTGINSVSNNVAELTVFPNPAIAGAFTMSLVSSTTEQAQFTIINVLGEMVKTFVAVTNKPVSIKLSVPAGVYFLSATTPHGNWNKRISVE